MDQSRVIEARYGAFPFLILFLSIVGSMILVFLFWIKGIRAMHIDDDEEIVLVNVAESFRTEVIKRQREAQEEYEIRKLAKIREREDRTN